MQISTLKTGIPISSLVTSEIYTDLMAETGISSVWIDKFIPKIKLQAASRTSFSSLRKLNAKCQPCQLDIIGLSLCKVTTVAKYVGWTWLDKQNLGDDSMKISWLGIMFDLIFVRCSLNLLL